MYRYVAKWVYSCLRLFFNGDCGISSGCDRLIGRGFLEKGKHLLTNVIGWVGGGSVVDPNILNLDPDPEFWPNWIRIRGYVSNFGYKI